MTRWLEDDVLIATGRSNVGQFLFFGWVDNQIVIASVFADDHPFVNFITWRHEQIGPFLQRIERKRIHTTAHHRHHHAVGAARAIEGGVRTLRIDGWNKVKAGITTIEEVLRVTQIEEHLDSLVEDTKGPAWVKA